MVSLTRGLAYALVTGGLAATIYLSGRCWSYENSHGLSQLARRDTCLQVWTVAGVVLALSQIAFMVIAGRMERGIVKTTILVMASLMVLGIVLFVALLTQMPS